jgi:hypothetical protein
MATVSQSRLRSNRSAAPQSALSPILSHAIAVAVKKLTAESRDRLLPGAYEVAENFRVVGTLTVGHDSETAGTCTPSADVLLGLVLSKMNAVTRQAILRDVAADFAAAENEYPDVPAEIVEATEAFTASLRRKVTQKRRGAVSGQFSISNLGIVKPALSVAG